MKMAFANDMEHPSRYIHTATRPTADGKKPPGAVAAGSARNPPPIVVPAIKAACEDTVVLVCCCDEDDPSSVEEKIGEDIFQCVGALLITYANLAGRRKPELLLMVEDISRKRVVFIHGTIPMHAVLFSNSAVMV